MEKEEEVMRKRSGSQSGSLAGGGVGSAGGIGIGRKKSQGRREKTKVVDGNLS